MTAFTTSKSQPISANLIIKTVYSLLKSILSVEQNCLSKVLTSFLQIRIIFLKLAFDRFPQKPRPHQERNTSRVFFHLCESSTSGITITRFDKKRMETGNRHNRCTLPRKFVWRVFLYRNENSIQFWVRSCFSEWSIEEAMWTVGCTHGDNRIEFKVLHDAMKFFADGKGIIGV